MATRLLFICGVYTLRSSLSSDVFQFPEIITASVGESFELKCTCSSPVQYCYKTIFWYKMDSRTLKVKQLEQGTNDELAKDKKSCVRTVSSAQVQHSGIYYCTSLSNTMFSIGNGTRVIITDKGPLKPTIVVYTPVEVDTPSVILQCVVMDAVPSQISVSWLIDGEEYAGWTESGWKSHNNSFSEYTRTEITIPTEDWEAAQIVQCGVKYGKENKFQILHHRSHSASSCTWLLYGGCAVAVFTITVVLTVLICLRKEKRKFQVKRQHVGRHAEREHQTQGKQDTLRTNVEKPSRISEVEYSCLNPEMLKR